MIKKKLHIRQVIGLSLIVLFTACSEFNTVYKSTDYEYKYKKAFEYYESKDFNHAVTLYQDLVYVFRGTSRGDDLYYYYANSLFEQRDYIMAGHYFKTLIQEYPKSEFAEESQFMIGYCYYKDSPKARLDQTITMKAIDGLRLFTNVYPFSDRKDEAEVLIDELSEKLVYKSYLNAKLYYDMEYYKAAVVALNNSLNDYPDTKYREELRFLLLKSKYLLAINSVEVKKRERLNAAYDEYFNFVGEFQSSKYLKDAQRFYKHTCDLLGYEEEEG